MVADEIVVSFNGSYADYLLILEDASRSFESMQNSNLNSGYLTTRTSSDSDFNGMTLAVAVDFDSDGMDEIIMVHANDSELSVQKFEDAGADFIAID